MHERGLRVMSVALVIIIAVTATVSVEIFKYLSEKKENPKVTKGSVVANGAEQLLIVFLSAIVAIFLANGHENRSRDEQIIKILDVAQGELKTQLSSFTAAAERGNRNTSSDEQFVSATMLYNAVNDDASNINLTDFLFSESAIVRIDPQIAAKIAYFEKYYIKYSDEYLNHMRNHETRCGNKNQIYDIVRYNVSMISLIEAEKSYLMGKPIYKGEGNVTAYLSNEDAEQYNKFLNEMKTLPEEVFEIDVFSRINLSQ